MLRLCFDSQASVLCYALPCLEFLDIAPEIYVLLLQLVIRGAQLGYRLLGE